MNKRLSDKVIIVTGASAGMGREIAERLANEKAIIVLASRRKNLLKKCAEKITASGCQSLVVPTDLKKPDQIKNLVKMTMKNFGRIDVLINVAAMGYYDWIEEQTYEELKEQLETNVLGTMELIRHVVPIMKAQRAGQIINFASYASQISTPPLTIYATTKYAIEGLSDGLRRELSPWNIKVTRVHPSAVNTNFNKKAKRHDGIDYPYDKITGVTKEMVAKRVIDSIYHPKIAIYVAKFQFAVDFVIFINRYFPFLIDLVFKSRVKKMWQNDRHHDPQK